jgi:hypothetical protein
MRRGVVRVKSVCEGMACMIRALGLWGCCLAAACVAAGAAPKIPLGKWCIDQEGLVISFRDDDTLSVQSTTDSTVNGTGAYRIQDSVFEACVRNGDLLMRLQYSYRWDSDSQITARPVFFIVNDDTVRNSGRWMLMRRCGSVGAGKAVGATDKRAGKGRKEKK